MLSVTKKGPGVVTGGDLTGDAAITVHNKNQVIATLTSDREFSIELEIRKGRGFVTSVENTPEEQIIGVIPIDSVYSPVTRVRYKTEDTPRRPEDQLRPPDHGNLDQRHDHPGHGPGRGRQDSAQAPQRVRAAF